MSIRSGLISTQLLLLALPCLCTAQTAVTLSSSPSPSIYGAPVVLTATITPATATGKVTFYDGATILGTKSVASGTAALSTIALPAGNRKLRAYFAGVTSNVVVQTVNARAGFGFVNVAQQSPISAEFFSLSVAADFNGDGHADIALYLNGLEVLLGDGAGNFTLAHTTTTLPGFPPYAAVGDFNGDGILDFAALFGTHLNILLGNGDGSFQSPLSTIIPHGDGLVVGDFNGDGIADIAIADATRGVDILIGKGDGTFQTLVSYPAGAPQVTAYQNIVAADFNGDGKADLATFQSVLLGNGDGTFRAPIPIVDTNTILGMLVGDFNGDGKPDLATRPNALNSTDILLGNGDGTFQAAVTYQTSNFSEDTNILSAVRDFNGDGIDDLIFSSLSSPSEPNVLLGKGDGTFQPPANDPFGVAGYYWVAGEFNGDGRTDFVMVDSTAHLNVLLGTTLTVTASGGAVQSAVSGSPFPSPLQALVKDGNTPLAGVTVTFTVPTLGGTVQLSSNTATTNANGVASVTATAGSRLGNYTVTATALGIPTAAQFQLTNLSGPASRIVPTPATPQATQVGTAFPQPLRIQLFDPQGIAVSGATVTFSAPSSGPSAILSPAAATGVFGDTSVTATANAIAGSYTITASYGGLSTTFSMVNLQAENVTLVSSPNPSTFGTPVTLTATLTNPSGTGRISFYSDGATLLGSRSVSNGSGTIASLLLPAGVHKLTAVYSGDPNVAGATSNAVTQSVRAVPGGNFLFQNPVSLPAVPATAVVGDFNGDGKADFAFSDNPTDPNPWWQVDLGSPQSIASLVIWNRTDCCASRLGDYWVFISNTPFLPTDTPATLQFRTGTFWSHQTSVPSPSATIATVGVQGQYVRVQLSNPDYLSLAEVQVFGTPGGAVLALGKAATQSSTYQGSGAVGAAAAVDGNTDGNFGHGSLSITDTTYAGVTVLLGNGDGTFRPAVTYRTGQTNTSSAAVMDFNGDGIPDLAVAGITGFLGTPAESLTILLGNGDGTFRAAVNYPGGPLNAGSPSQFGPLPAGTVGSMVAGDFNGDGFPDVLINSVFNFLVPCGGDNNFNCFTGLGSFPKVHLLPGNGDGTFGATSAFQVPSVPFLVADFNGNGKFDVVGSTAILLDSTTSHPLSISAPTFAADFNGDGNLDLAAGATTLLGTGDGRFQAAQNLPQGDSAALQGDFNGDGIVDIAVTNGVTLNGVVYGNGDGTFRAANMVNAGVPLAVADFNGDGRADILTASASGVTLLLGSTNTPVTVTAVGGTPQSTLTGAPFTQPLQVKVTNNGAPVVGALVVFAAPPAGPSATLSAYTVQTDAAGLASVTAIANFQTGNYLVTASSQGVSATFSLTNTIPLPASITAVGGTPQSTTLGGTFANPLQVIVKDAAGRPFSGATVDFAVPSSGASATLSSGVAVTNSAGVASVTAIANHVAGSYNVTANVGPYTTQFALTNLTGQSSNLALGRPATQSSTYPGAPAAQAAVDGNTDGNYFDGSVTATNPDTNPWWQVDLGASSAITSIVVFNRTDCCGSRLSDYWVFVSDSPFLASDTAATLQSRPFTFASHQTSAPSPSTTIPAVTQGRYVRVQLTSPNYLSLAEVEVFGAGGAPPPTNLSQNKFASQSSTLPGFTSTVAASAVDGNTDGGFYDGSVTATNFETNPWWQVDLGGSASVSSIVIWNRTDCCSSRLGDYWVFVSDTPFLPTDTPATLQNRAGTFAFHQTSAPSPSATITSPSQGRYVRIQLSGTDYLSLAEVQVMGSGAPSISNLAQGKAATQSSLYDTIHDLPSAAVDGNTDGNFYDGSVAVTFFQTTPWWQVDLGSSAFVSSIVIWNRTDCCGSRLSDYWVFVSDTPFQAGDTPATLQNRAGTFASHQTSAPSPSVNIPVGVQGRYVRVQLSGSDYLTLAEVQVFGQ